MRAGLISEHGAPRPRDPLQSRARAVSPAASEHPQSPEKHGERPGEVPNLLRGSELCHSLCDVRLSASLLARGRSQECLSRGHSSAGVEE